jgi:hypothetical protein
VLAPKITTSGLTIKYYSKTTGKTYEVGVDGSNRRATSETGLPGLTNVTWSPDGTRVISMFSRGTDQTQFFYYNYTTGIGLPLKNNLDTVVWQNDNKIFYKYYNPGTKERSLNVSDPDGTNWSKIADLPYKDVSIAPIPKTGLVSFWNKPNSNVETNFQTASILTPTPKTIFRGRTGADYRWSLDGNKALVSHTTDTGGIALAVINSQGGEYKNLEAPTVVSKTIWSKDNKTVYFALPGSVPAGSVMPDDYLNGKFNTTDTFWRVDVTTGKKDRIVSLDKINGQFDATDLFLNTDESMLFFINRSDQKLYRINL